MTVGRQALHSCPACCLGKVRTDDSSVVFEGLPSAVPGRDQCGSRLRMGSFLVQPLGSKGWTHVLVAVLLLLCGGYLFFSFKGSSCTLEKYPYPFWVDKDEGGTALGWPGAGLEDLKLPVRARWGLGCRGCPCSATPASGYRPGGTKTLRCVPSVDTRKPCLQGGVFHIKSFC